jgi:hypothetical protein
MRRFSIVIALSGLLGGVLAGCGPSTRVPADAQLVHVLVTPTEVRMDPTTARAGDIYLVLDAPTESVMLVKRKSTAEEAPGPMTIDDLARLAQGDQQGTSMEGFDNGACDPARRSADRGLIKIPGGCGNVFLVPLSPGKYAFIKEDPAAAPPGQPVQMAVLEVLP